MENTNTSKRVLVTRQLDQSLSVVNLLSSLGHYPFILPMIETIQCAPDFSDHIYDIIIFTSPNGCRYFAPYADKIKGNFYIAVGSATLDAMRSYLHIKADKIPTTQSIEGIKDILRKLNLKDTKILMPGPKLRTEFDESEFTALGAMFFYPIIYETVFTEYDKKYIEDFLDKNSIDTLTFCSPSAAKSFIMQVDIDYSKYDILSIGQTTSDFLNSFNIANRHPDNFTVEDMIKLI